MPVYRCYSMRMQRYPFLFLLLSLPVFSAQNSPEPQKLPADNAPSAATAPKESVPRGPVAAPGAIITAEQWARPRSGDSVVKLPGLATLVEAVERDAASRLVVRFAGGDEGSLWAEELRSWLVALGLPSARIQLEPGLPQSDALRLELRPPR